MYLFLSGFLGGGVDFRLFRALALFGGNRSDLHIRPNLPTEAHLLQFPRLYPQFRGDAFSHFLEVFRFPEHGDFFLSPFIALNVSSLAILLGEVHSDSLLSHKLISDDQCAAAGVSTTHDITFDPSRLGGAGFMAQHHIHFRHRHYQWLIISGRIHH